MKRNKLAPAPKEKGGIEAYIKHLDRFGGLIIAATLFVVILAVALFSNASSAIPLPFNNCVGVMEITGELTVEGSPATVFLQGSPGSEKIAETIEAINDRQDVKSVVFVVDSPGGSVVASQDIYSAIKKVEKPKVVYIRQMGASGGYYISLAADEIMANPDALTGSIGVISIIENYEGLLEKIGVNITSVTSGEHKDFASPFKSMDEKEIEIMQVIINESFDEFKSLVIKERGSKLKMDKFDEITDGRIMSGRQAYAYGLVDSLGNKQDAIKKAAKLGNVTSEDPSICEIKSSLSSTGGLFSELTRGIATLFSAQDTKAGVYYK